MLEKEIINKLHNNVTLTSEECRRLCDSILDNKISKDELVDILTKLNENGFGSDELSGFAQSMRNFSVKVKTTHMVVDNCGTGGDQSSSFNISTASSILASSCGVKVAKHGNKSITSKSGSADVLSELGININLKSEMLSASLDKNNFAFMFAPLHHMAMKYVAEARKIIAPEKTIFNLLGPLTNPAGATRQMIGVFSQSVMYDMAEALIKLGVEKALVIHSNDGLDEVSLFKKTKILAIENNNIKEEYFDPVKYFNYDDFTVKDLKANSPKESAEIILDIAQNKKKNIFRHIVSINSAFILLLADMASDFESALEICEEKIDNGSMINKIEQLREFTNKNQNA